MRYPTRASELDHRRPERRTSTCARCPFNVPHESERFFTPGILKTDIRALFSGHIAEFDGRRVAPWQELIQAALRMTCDNAADDVGEITVRLDAIELAGLDQ
jgi:hypothetical protein